MKRVDCKSHCPINYALETFGDPWSLLIVRDIIYFGKRTYGEFIRSEERMATNILAQRLCHLEKDGILSKKPHPADKRREIYELTEKGLQLIPLTIEMGLWGVQFDNKTAAPNAWVDALRTDKQKVLDLVYKTVKEGGAVFVGQNSVINRLNITLESYLLSDAK